MKTNALEIEHLKIPQHPKGNKIGKGNAKELQEPS
jgi:hypothetical protein